MIVPASAMIQSMTCSDRVTRVSHALCQADGNDPEAVYTVHDPDEDGGRLRERQVARWTLYTGEARRLIAAMVALGIVEEPDIIRLLDTEAECPTVHPSPGRADGC